MITLRANWNNNSLALHFKSLNVTFIDRIQVQLKAFKINTIFKIELYKNVKSSQIKKTFYFNEILVIIDLFLLSKSKKLLMLIYSILESNHKDYLTSTLLYWDSIENCVIFRLY